MLEMSSSKIAKSLYLWSEPVGALVRIIHHSRGTSLGIRYHSTFASLTNTGSISSVTENTVITNTFTALRSVAKLVLLQLRGLVSTPLCSATTVVAIHSLSGELSRLVSRLSNFRKSG